MRPPGRDREAVHKRFQTNMRRIRAITKALPALAGDEGVRADMLRALVVFLHATLEDFIRSHLPTRRPEQWTFGKSNALKQALDLIGVGRKGFDYLMGTLDSLAERRHRIVHHADLGETQVEAAAEWTIGDDTMLVHWNLAVLSFVYRVRKATGPVSVIEDRAEQNCVAARAKLFEYVELVLSLDAGLPRDEIRRRMDAAARALDEAKEAMKLEVGMFLDAEGNPLPGALLESDGQSEKE